MRLVMVGLDGSESSAVACCWAAKLATQTDAQLIGASAWQPHQSEVTPDDIATRRTAVGRQLEEEWCEPARLAGLKPRPLLLDGSPDVLLGAAEAQDADLLVVGSRGAGGMAGLHLGSVAHHLARHTTRPLAIVPAISGLDLSGPIVVGVDGSPGSAAAVRWCAEVAPALSAQVVAVAAWDPFVEWFPDRDPRNWRHRVEAHVEDWIEPLRAANVAVTKHIVRDVHPVAAISDAAREQGQLVVVGTHGLGGFPGMRLGGVAVQLVHHTSLPVVLVPVPASPPHPATESSHAGSETS